MKTLVALCVLTATIAGTAAAAASTTSARQAIAKLKAAGLPIGAYRVYTPATDPNALMGRPGQYVSKANFQDRRIPVLQSMVKFDTTGGGSIEVFTSTTDAKRRYQYVKRVTQGFGGPFVEYDYQEGRGLIRLSARFTPTQARSYERVFRRIYRTRDALRAVGPPPRRTDGA
jgi:hypothetical protein